MRGNPYLPADVEAVLADQIDELRPRLRANVRWYAALEVARDNPALSAELRDHIHKALESAEYTINRLSLERYWATEEKRQLEARADLLTAALTDALAVFDVARGATVMGTEEYAAAESRARADLAGAGAERTHD